VRRSYLTLVGVCIFWGTIPLVVKNVHLDAAAIVSVRLWVAAAGLGAALLVRRRTDPGRRLLSFRPALSVASAVTLAVHWFCLFGAYKRAPAGTVILIVYLAPVGIAAIAPRVLGEVLGRRTLGALAVAALGFVLVAAPAVGHASGAGLLLAVAAALSFVVLVVASKPLAEAYGGLRLAFMEMAGAGLVLLPIALSTPWGHPQPAWLWLVVLGLAHTAVGTGLYLAALGRVPATHVGILGYLEPASVVACGWLFLHQRPDLATVVGGIMIVAAGALVLAPGTPAGEVAAVAGR
jgi:drug/metabolite transporter (DMT)-like permease